MKVKLDSLNKYQAIISEYQEKPQDFKKIR